MNRATLSTVFHRLVPASAYGGQTAFAMLRGIDAEIRTCQRADSAVAILETAKPALYQRLSARCGAPAAQALTLKILNLFLARYHLRTRRRSVLSRPFGLIIDPSNMCQLACPGCVHSTRAEGLKVFDWPNGTLSEERLRALLKLYGPHAIGAYFCNYGEPLLNLRTPKLIRLAKTYLMATALSTSLSVRRFDAEAYVESGLDFMILSIDGATQAVYERFRRNGDLELVFQNIRALVEARRKLGKRTPTLSWNFLAFEHNAHEIPLATRLARKLGVDQFRVVHPFEVRWDDPEIRPAPVKAGVRKLDWLSIANRTENWNPFPESLQAEEFARAYERPWPQPAVDEGAPTAGHACHWLYKNMVMDAAGRILPCCGAPRPNSNLVFAAFDGDGGDPFNSPKHREARAWFTGASPSLDTPYCAKCEWDQTTVNVGGPEIERYFRAADPAFFDARSLRLLSD